MDNKLSVEVESKLPTDWGEFRMIAFSSSQGIYSPDLALVHPDVEPNTIVPVRIHSECITGDLFHSQRCDCGQQLDLAMNYIAKHKGVLIYLRQEGRGIGIINKLKAYNKQDEGLDTVQANQALGLEVDSRSYQKAIDILELLGVKRINLLTNNPDKMASFEFGPIELVNRLPLEIPPTEESNSYLKTKKDSLGHFLSLKK